MKISDLKVIVDKAFAENPNGRVTIVDRWDEDLDWAMGAFIDEDSRELYIRANIN